MIKNAQLLLLLFVAIASCGPAWAGELTVQSLQTVSLELTGFVSLSEFSLFKGKIAAGGKRQIKTPYHGLALLVFGTGQSYPVLIGTESFNLMIVDPDKRPVFTGSLANDYFYQRLVGLKHGHRRNAFADLMLEAKDLLESSYNIKTVPELSAKKREFLGFVGKHFLQLRHSDMVMRLIAQYFMMLEYVNYHVKGAPPTDIQKRYQSEVLSGVKNWLALLTPHLPKYEVLNYCVGFYYRRSMVTLAIKIIDNFRESAFCPGTTGESYKFSGNMKVRGQAGDNERKLADFKGDKIIAFVSDDCPVSLVETVVEARRLAVRPTGAALIVAPLGKMSKSYLSMARMVRSDRMFFIDKKEWNKGNLVTHMRLPFFLMISAESVR